MRWLILLEALAWTVGVPLGLLWLSFALDNWLHLPVWGRILAGLAFLGTLAGLLWRMLTNWRRTRLSEDEVALAMERRTPGGVENRLINSLQLTRGDQMGDVAFSEAVVEENFRFLEHVTIEQAAQMRPVMVRIVLATLIVGVGVAFWGLQREHFTNAAARILMPFADVQPIYQTRLRVEPGDVQSALGQDVAIQIHVEGKVPEELMLMRSAGGRRASVRLPLEKPEKGGNAAKVDQVVTYTFAAVSQVTSYSIRGGDYTTPTYQITVPVPSRLTLVRAAMEYPAYTRQAPKTVQSTTGELEALRGTKATVTFVLDRAADQAELLVSGTAGGEARRIALKRQSGTEFAGALEFNNVTGYQIETKQRDWPAFTSQRYGVRVLADQPPKLTLSGVDPQADVTFDMVLPLKVSGEDDFGLTKMGLFHRAAPTVMERSSATQPVTQPAEQPWRPIKLWDVAGQAVSFQGEFSLPVAALEAAEGDRLELSLQGVDNDPLKGEAWTVGPVHLLRMGGEGAALQVTYEKILATEAGLRQLMQDQEQAVTQATRWQRRLEPAEGKDATPVRWDESKNLEALAEAVKGQIDQQQQLRTRMGQIAGEMVQEAGDLRLSVGMLADTEMVRAVRILRTVVPLETVQQSRTALADARLTEERTLRSLEEIQKHYVQFRQDWELSNMLPFVRMMADRQRRMSGESGKYADHALGELAAAVQRSMGRRQEKMVQLAGLSRTAFAGLSQRADVGEVMAAAFIEASTALADSQLLEPMAQGMAAAKDGKWSEASVAQQSAADRLEEIHQKLNQVRADLARRLAQTQPSESDVQAQAAIEDLRPGSDKKLLNVDLDSLTLSQIVKMGEVAGKDKDKEDKEGGKRVFDYVFSDMKKLYAEKGEEGRDFSLMHLGDAPGSGSKSFPNQSDREGNTVTPYVMDKFEDLVGDLLVGTQQLTDDYETYNLQKQNTGAIEPGAVGQQAGDMASTAAEAATGNLQPPPNDFGGVSRSGRPGARAHGMMVGDEMTNLPHGFDQAPEGQMRTPDQEGTLKETNPGVPPADASTGLGGKKIETPNPTHFSTKDKGDWMEDTLKRMDRPKDVNQIVERMGKPVDAKRLHEALRDLEDTQEQVIERIKALKKELGKLYLPTDHLDEIARQLQSNLEKLKESPDADVFRLQLETLDKLRGIVVVFDRPSSEFLPSLKRDQRVRGRILDEPAREPIPSYEEAVKRYYQNLAER